MDSKVHHTEQIGYRRAPANVEFVDTHLLEYSQLLDISCCPCVRCDVDVWVSPRLEREPVLIGYLLSSPTQID